MRNTIQQKNDWSYFLNWYNPYELLIIEEWMTEIGLTIVDSTRDQWSISEWEVAPVERSGNPSET